MSCACDMDVESEHDVPTAESHHDDDQTPEAAEILNGLVARLESAFEDTDWKKLRETEKNELIIMDTANPGLGMGYEKEATMANQNW